MAMLESKVKNYQRSAEGTADKDKDNNNNEDKGKNKISSAHDRYSGIRRVGPESLRHFKRTYREALKRMISSGTFMPDKPVVVPVPDDKRYRSWKTINEPITNAVIIYMMDVSGSMGDEQKERAA